MASKYSGKTLAAFAAFMEWGFTHTTMEQLFMSVSVPDGLDAGHNKLQRALTVLKSLSHSPTHTDRAILDALLQESVRQRKEAFHSKYAEQVTGPLLESLRTDGFDVVDGRIVLSDDTSVVSAVGAVKEAFDPVDSQYVAQQIKRMESAIGTDPALAIGTAKELIETCCKTILKSRSAVVPASPNLPQLVKATAKELQLTPEDIPEGARASEAIKRMLSSLSQIADSIAEVRNHHGTGHGKESSTKGLETRHAKLAVGAASTLSVFLMDTHMARQNER